MTYFATQQLIPFVLMGVLSIGFLCQWIAWRLKLPAISFLLLAGIFLGPISGRIWGSHYQILHPDALFGEALYPFISIAVSIILFEGSLTLKFSEIKGLGATVRNLVSFGLIITMGLTALLVHYIVGLDWATSFLIGGISAVSGPTVVGPMLRSTRLKPRLAKIIRWEGILVDPLGAVLAVIIYITFVSIASNHNPLIQIILHILGIFGIGVVVGIILGYWLGVMLRHYWVPGYLKNMFVLSFVITAFVISEHIVEGGGLIIVTTMGIVIANMKNTHIDEILDFKENLSLILISSLFIILGANINFNYLNQLWLWVGLLVILLQFVVRPFVVALCTSSKHLTFNERILLAWLYPRGIIAASVAALFSVKMMDNPETFSQAHFVVLVVFLIIVGTVTLQSLTAPWLARWLKVSLPEPNGFLLIGSNRISQAIGKALQQQGASIVMIDNSWKNTQDARLKGFNCYYGNVISDQTDRHIPLEGIGRMLGLCSSHHVNALTAVKYAREFGKNHIFLLPSDTNTKSQDLQLTQRYSQRLFGTQLTYEKLDQLLANHWQVKTTLLTDSFNWQAYREQHPLAIPLFWVTPKGMIIAQKVDAQYTIPASGWRVISLLPSNQTIK